jgi:hypothetical protein
LPGVKKHACTSHERSTVASLQGFSKVSKSVILNEVKDPLTPTDTSLSEPEMLHFVQHDNLGPFAPT